MPKKSKSSAPPGTFFEEGELRDIKTKQKVIYSTHCCTVYRETLPQRTELSQMEAMRVMERTYKKRQTHATLNALDDRFTITKNKHSGKEPFRPWLSYKEIADIQQSTSKRGFFVLTINSAASGNCYYEVYKCKSKDDAQKFEDYVRQARSRPSFTISGKGDVIQQPQEKRSISNFEEIIPSPRHSPVYNTTSPGLPRGYSLYSPNLNVNAYANTYNVPSPEIETRVRAARSPIQHRNITIYRSNSYERRLQTGRYTPPDVKHHSLPAMQYSPVQRYNAPVVSHVPTQQYSSIPVLRQSSPEVVYSKLTMHRSSPPFSLPRVIQEQSPPFVRRSSPLQYAPMVVKYSPEQRYTPPIVSYTTSQRYTPPVVRYSPERRYTPPIVSYTTTQRYTPPVVRYSPERRYTPPIVSYTTAQRYTPPVRRYSPEQRYTPPVGSYSLSQPHIPLVVRRSSPERYTPPKLSYTTQQRYSPPLVNYSPAQRYTPPISNQYINFDRPVKIPYLDMDPKLQEMNDSPEYVYSPNNGDVDYISDSPFDRY